MPPKNPSEGYSLLELIAVIVMISLVAAAALPSFRSATDRVKARAALDRIAAELYRARMLAVHSGAQVRLVFSSDARGCVEVARLVVDGSSGISNGPHLLYSVPGGPCLRHTGDSIVAFNSRGLLRPPTRSFFVSYGQSSDSLLLSIAGRVRRSY